MVKKVFGVLLMGIILVSGTGWIVYQSQLHPGHHSSLDPAITDFKVTNATCVDHFSQSVNITQISKTERTHIIIQQNVKVPNQSFTLAAENLHPDGSDYTMLLIGRATDTSSQVTTPPQDCTMRVRYTATIRLPHGQSEPFSLSVRYDGKELTAITHSASGSGAGASGSGDNNDE